MALKLHRTGADEYGKYLKVMIAGDPGAGKTRSASTWDQPLIASLGANLMSVADRAVNYVPIDSSSDLADLRVLLANPPEVREQIFGFPVNTIVIDTLDHFQEVLVVERKKAHKIDEFGPADWGWLNDEMAAMVRGFRNLPLHVVFHLHLKLTEDMLSGQVYFKPSLVGQMGDKIAAYVDVALAFKGDSTLVTGEDGETSERVLRRWAQTYRDDQHPWIRDNSGKLPPEFEINFTDDFARLYEAVYTGLDLPTSGQARELDISQVAVIRQGRMEEGLADPIPGAPTPADVKAASNKGKPAPQPAKAAPKRTITDEEAVRSGKTKEELATTPAPVVPPIPDNPEFDVDVEPDDMPNEDELGPALLAAASEPEAAAEAALVAELSNGSGPPGNMPSMAGAKPAGPTPEELAAAAATTEMVPCSECGGVIETEDQFELSTVRFRRPMCRKCHVTAKRNLSSTHS